MAPGQNASDRFEILAEPIPRNKFASSSRLRVFYLWKLVGATGFENRFRCQRVWMPSDFKCFTTLLRRNPSLQGVVKLMPLRIEHSHSFHFRRK